MRTSRVDQGRKCVENYRNIITKREVNVCKNITAHCGKNITPKHGHNPAKKSIANKNINIARDNMFRDTKSHYSRVKVSQNPPKTMACYPDMKIGQRCESDNNNHSMNNIMVLFRGATLQTIVTVVPLIILTKQKVRSITQPVLKIGFGLYVLRTRLTLVHMVTNTLWVSVTMR